MDEDFGDLVENTERSAVDPEPSKGGREVGAALKSKAPVARDAPLTRERRSTVVSSIPAQLAKSMGQVRDPSAPTLPPPHQGARPVPAAKPAAVATDSAQVGTPASLPSPSSASQPSARQPADSQPVELAIETTDTYNVEVVDEPSLAPRAHIQALVERARNFMDGGNLGAAVIAADQALAEASKAPQDDVAGLIKDARPLFDRIFASYVGLLGQVPVRVRSDEELAGQELGERTTYLLSHVDGAQTLEELSRTTGIPPVEAMKIAASLLAAGIVRT
jgi:hypothetical protein